MKYGLPYKGSKNKLAERIVRLLPRRTHLVDLFCGGCAVSHAALVMGKYEHIHINDNNWMCPTLFMDALAGKYNDEKRWISREDFFRLRDTDPYVAVVWSFGNNLRDYLYSQEIEPLKKAIHYAIFFSDYSLGKELGHDLSFIDGVSDVQKRYLLIKRYFSQFGHFQQQSLMGRCKSSTMLGSNGSLKSGGRVFHDSNQPKQTCGSTPTFRTGGVRGASARLETAERLLNISRNTTLSNAQRGGCFQSNDLQICNTWTTDPGLQQFKKKCKRPWESKHRERANSIASLAVSGATALSANHFGGGNIADYIQCA